ncbi:hypothetical protein CLAFUW4_00941 [Fulvia fulva]|uniref:Uncharacterized protein n=1 Tax=Passalora fulva TaxID=5499 RepID=A0A9Q8P405_PASFU|nr:uncharacterized protein CLAFUR5_00947 [Fulvia fulva]KAK4634563.1 hypothetical protein CLAFUR4_00942 [Fulvia fulva]KAK4638659.1 hypothetical protein CLAFUR0_00943 [Fulvia fulva]UJO12359.1 hypothetical protein CLAFUR5_00947 [Fulvia fulva]WPV09616.1 hypothetical protein CLAFUW4_00941 [Fulvia fulva]WPV23870.1 hypothetical protein CLAFUW7_00875 [Fulvia fulva]
MTDSAPTLATTSVQLPRVAITYCTQCKWLLRAAYFAQELLSTFGTSIGEIALIPATGGIFTVYVTHVRTGSDGSNANSDAAEVMIWDRKAEGGFPETKILKQKLRNLIEPEKNLGHSDTPSSKPKAVTAGKDEGVAVPHPQAVATASTAVTAEECKDCT